MGSSYIWAKPISKCYREDIAIPDCPEIWVAVVPTDQADQITQYFRDSWNRVEAGGEIWSFRAEAVSAAPAQQDLSQNTFTQLFNSGQDAQPQAITGLSPDSAADVLLGDTCDETGKLTIGLLAGAVIGFLAAMLYSGLTGRST